ncbi:MAG: NAD-dependent epimerase/dehydratase family protein, partial [Dolichospermum sp.]
MNKQILITGGAGFVGSALAIGLAQRYPDCKITALDNLKRRGSELNLPRLKQAGIQFVHGDIRNQEDLDPIALQPDLIL